MIASLLRVALIVYLGGIVSQAARTRLRNTLDVKFNIGCKLKQCIPDSNSSAVNLFQIISSNPESPDKINYILSNIGGPPIIITTSSSKESQLEIDWEVLLGVKPPVNNSGFHFDVMQDASIGLLLEKIILFDDNDKSGRFTPGKPFIEIDWAQVVWDLASRATYHKDDFLKTTFRMRTQHPYLNGNILVRLAIPRGSKAERQKEVPHLKLNSQSISVVIIVDGVNPPPQFKNTRLALTYVVVVQAPDSEVLLEADSESLISDEYTPGVFRIKSLQFKSKQAGVVPIASPPIDDGQPQLEAIIAGSKVPLKDSAMEDTSLAQESLAAKDKLGFLYWKEVAYTDRRKIISRTIDVYDYEKKMPLNTLPNISQPFYQYFNYRPSESRLQPNYKLFRIELIFGKGDATYGVTNFTDFSFVFGLGMAPEEQMFSLLVKMIIFVCFCLPILVMLAGLGYLMLRRFRRTGDTELLLAAES